MLFILFDIEIVFLYPLAVQLDLLGWFGFVEFRVRRDPRRRVRLHLAEGGRWSGTRAAPPIVSTGRPRRRGSGPSGRSGPDRGPGVFEQELESIEDALMTTTVEKAIAWAQSGSMWPDTFGPRAARSR